MLFCCHFLYRALTILSHPTKRISHNCINVLSVNTDRDGEREREKETEILLQPSKKKYKEDNFINKIKYLFCNCSCPIVSRATKCEPMRTHPGFYFYNWMLILEGWFVVGEVYIHHKHLATRHPADVRPTSLRPPLPSRVHTNARAHTHTHTHTHTTEYFHRVPSLELDMSSIVPALRHHCILSSAVCLSLLTAVSGKLK
jgi:hypothetical protein